MDGNLFSEWVKKLDRKFAAQERKVALIIDNCPAHPSLEGLQAIELIFLPPNTTSKTQPMDQGVIRSLKAFYRASLIGRYIADIDQGKDPKLPNILEAMILLTAAWDRVSSVTLVNCFRKAGISSNHQLQSLADDDDPFKFLMEQVDELKKLEGESVDFTVEEFLDADKDTLTCETQSLSAQEILLLPTQPLNETNADTDAVDGENDDEEVDFVMTPPSNSEVLNALKVLQTTCLYHDVGEEMRKNVNSFGKLYEVSTIKNKKQKCITDLF